MAGTTMDGKNNFLSSQAYQMMLQLVGDIVETAHITLFFCDIIKCAVFLLNMKFGRYLKMVNNKSIMFKQLITVQIWKFCVVGNLSDEILSTSAARFRCIICDKTLKCDHSWI